MLFQKVFPAPFHYLTVPVTLPQAFPDERWDFAQLASINPVITFTSTAIHKLLHITPLHRLLITLSWHMVTAAVEPCLSSPQGKHSHLRAAPPRARIVTLLQQLPSFSLAATQRWNPGWNHAFAVTSPPMLFNPLSMLPPGAQERQTWSKQLKTYRDNLIWRVGKRMRPLKKH